MIGIFLITHGIYGAALIQNAYHVYGRCIPKLSQLGVMPEDDPQELTPIARRMLALTDSGSGSLILTDISGASPANLAVNLIEPGRIEVVAGVNLPMLLRAINYREGPLAAVIEKAIEGGCKGIIQLRKPDDCG